MLLYPGGVREAFKRRGEAYRLFWPARAEFVRMAARAGAVILPLAAVGADESLGLLLDSDEIRASPLLNRDNRVEADAARYPRVRCALLVGVADVCCFQARRRLWHGRVSAGLAAEQRQIHVTRCVIAATPTTRRACATGKHKTYDAHLAVRTFRESVRGQSRFSWAT